MAGIKYEQLYDGEWVRLFSPHYFQCCTCGLVHQIEFRIKDGKKEFRVFTDWRKTGQVRRHKKKRELSEGV